MKRSSRTDAERQASAEATPARAWIWVQLAIGWLPVWVLYASMILSMHGGPVSPALLIAGRAIGVAALLGLLVLRWTEHFAWPRQLSLGFVAGHLAAASAFAARSQLAALRGQLNPHFLFNALHTVVQLIPVDPTRAGEATEQLAGLLRTASEEDRDLVPLREECTFVERYLALEALRFGDRLRWRVDLDEGAMDAVVPSLVLQTLVENSVRHGAAPREEPTTLTLTARVAGTELLVEVSDTGAGAESGAAERGGTGLRRLRERLAALYGAGASLVTGNEPAGGFTATVRLPFDSVAEA